MENRSHALAAGIFVLLLGLATAAAIWYLGGKREQTETYALTTKRNVTGLNPQAQVRYRGIRAGKVESIEPDADDPRLILIRINLDARFRLTKASTAKLGYQGITGLAHVQIEDDGSNAEPLATGGSQPPRIAMSSSLFDTLGDKAGDIVGQIAETTTRLSKLLDEKNAANFSRTLANVAEASEGMKQAPLILAGLREAVSETNLKKLHLLLSHLERTAGEAAPLTADVREMVKAMTALSHKVDRIADRVGGEMTAATLPQLTSLMTELTANSRQIGRLIDSLDDNPQALVFGKAAPRPGPGETGFVTPTSTEK